MTNKKQWRSTYLAIHLYLGLTLGLVFVVAGLTGSVLVFYNEIDELVNPILVVPEEDNRLSPKPLEAIFEALKSHHPERTKAWRLEMPRHDRAMIMARYYQPVETAHLKFAPLISWVNPYTAEIVSSRFWGQYLVTWIYDLHYQLLLDKWGKWLMGAFGSLLLISLFTGVYLWWPRAKNWRNALTLKRHSSQVRLNYDLHKFAGVYALPLMGLLLITGILLELPEIFNPLVNRFSETYRPSQYQSQFKVNASPITLDQAVAVALKRFPEARLRWLETAKDSNDTFRVFLYQVGEPSQRFPKTHVWIDQFTGRIQGIRNPRKQSGGDLFLSLLHPLHSGEILELPGRIFIFISGFIPLVLFITGFIRWQQKRKAKNHKKGSILSLVKS